VASINAICSDNFCSLNYEDVSRGKVFWNFCGIIRISEMSTKASVSFAGSAPSARLYGHQRCNTVCLGRRSGGVVTGGFMNKRILSILLLSACSAFAQSGKPSAAVSKDDDAAPVPQEQSIAQMSQRVQSPALIPTGTPIYFRLEQILSTRKSRIGDRFVGRVTRPVVVNGRTVISAGAHLNGVVLKADEPRRIKGHSSIGLRPDNVVLADGTTVDISAIIVDTSNPKQYHVTEEGRIKGPAVHDLTNVETAALAGTGAVGGMIVAGPVGMLVGAGSGAAISGGHALTKRHEMMIPTSLEIIAELNRPATPRSSARASLSQSSGQ
jgi:hypothetical protein